MRRFLEYLFMDDDEWEYLFPSPIGHFVAVILIIFCIVTCSRKDDKKDEVKHIDMTLEVDTTQYPAVQVEDIETDSTKLVISKSKYWSSKETGLPVGIVYMMDYAGSGEDEGDANQGDNYVTIKSPDGRLKVISDIDVDLYLSLQKGDTIK